jgi:nucleoside-diphosphate-sugar epimerase
LTILGKGGGKLRVLVTGHKGFLGYHVCRKLREIPVVEVVEVDNGCYEIDSLENRMNYGRLQIKDLEGVDAVIHLAWFSSAGDALPDCQRSHRLATSRFFERCVKAGVKRFVFASTASVYGFADGEVDESSMVQPTCSYGKEKLDTERYLESHCEDTGLTIFRKGTLMGASERQRLDLCVNAFVYSAWKDGIINVWGPETHRPILHVEDAAEAYAKAALANHPGVWNLGHKNYQMLALAHWVKHIMESSNYVRNPIEVKIDYKQAENRSYWLNCMKAQGIFSLARGVSESIYPVIQKMERMTPNEWRTCRNVPWAKETFTMRTFLSSLDSAGSE